ncbi:hypothetical protein BATDEDRAFT_30558 [Batrachochytrium dendrobatidis JAM81]|uniref:Uncharacterized protein n=2 Tax=Batrachochytrium dendrobatidis TaxID=109871 RepID=F4P9E8_BATDJ|nr:uncharacterized protein BATDEDRAFT_30558 [Batrachochytrium dendrobatidis JAM81]EGF78215.1 hypothetical protein BATDEDRAFT_30558 [Batrachochytrium dendrobatidis JAM81]OAJ44567.1 hypothetical protein BDEG_27781 [Batrachochytrium dendrobatidis JEL423]|eukprot:XP_006681129.1 hypothetical protein BATDEDRAFT_30558 [Batrachochytrium dendrobatidis JAM81]
MSPNGQSYILSTNAQSLANYPHARKANGFLFISGISSRRLDNTWEGVNKLPDGSMHLDIKSQTRGVINNLDAILRATGASLANVLDLTVFLIDMKYYDEFNSVYNEFFNAEHGPTRTTVAVKQLPNPNLLIEIKAVALANE